MKDYYTPQELAEVSEESQDILMHIGTATSGRYPKGSGKNPYQHMSPGDLEWIQRHQRRLKEFKAQGLDSNEVYKKIADLEGMSVNALRSKINIMREQQRQYNTELAKNMFADGRPVREIIEKTGWSETSVRKALNQETLKERADRITTQELVARLKESVAQTGYLDVGEGVEAQLGVSEDRLKSARRALVDSGEYAFYKINVPNATNPMNKPQTAVLTTADKTIKDVYDNKDKIRSTKYRADSSGTTNIQKLQDVTSIPWNRLQIKYAIPEGEKGHGTEKDGETQDGVMYIRPGSKDINLGGKKYAQVRIAVGDTHYLKGMAIYGDNKMFPDGVDVIFNTNKKKGTPKEDVLKPLNLIDGKINQDDPFSAAVKRQPPLLDKKGNPVVDKVATAAEEKRIGHKLSTPIYKVGKVNIVNEEGDWNDWSKTLSSQFLAKQPRPVVRERLRATLKEHDTDYDEIMKVDNPIVKRKLLEDYIQTTESKAVHIKASAPAGFRGHVLLPVPNMKENEVFAPRYEDGTRVILVRYPHAGRFEIPELIVNNKGPGKKLIGGDSPDAIGIHPKVAGKLSGADFDGDVAYVIPNNEGKYKSAPMLKELKGFDPKQYKDPEGSFKPISKEYQQKQMGIVSNLITDMTLRGASNEELARATKHSMVVIDAYKHKLNYKRSEKENRIPELRKNYMEHVDRIDYDKLSYYDKRTRKELKVTDLNKLNKDKDGISLGASSVLSRRKQTVKVGGENVEIIDKNGKKKVVNRGGIDVPITSVIKDASVYLGPKAAPVEKEYVDYINNLKARQAKAENELASIKTPKKSPVAAKIYTDEVNSLNEKVKLAKLNKPRERQAQILANSNIQRELDRATANGEELSKADVKKLRAKAITAAREEVGAHRNPVKITDIEWDAIQANAISTTKLQELIKYMDSDQLKSLATPRPTTTLSKARADRAAAMIANGHTYAEVAKQLGVSTSTINRYVKES